MISSSANLKDTHNSLSGHTRPQLLALASETLQVIDGVFEAFRHGERSPWIKLEAIDSTYSFHSDDEVLLFLSFEVELRTVGVVNVYAVGVK